MNRRELLKFSSLAPLAGLFKVEPKTQETIPGHFWMQVYGPHYNPKDIEPNWERFDTDLIGVYMGENLFCMNASDYPIGVRFVHKTGRHYMCYGANATMHGIAIKNGGVYANRS